MNRRHLPLLILAGFAVLYGLAILWYVPTQPGLGFHALLTNSHQGNGIDIVEVHPCNGPSDDVEIRWPRVGDRVLQVGPVRIRSFHDLATARQVVRDLRVDPGGQIAFSQDPARDATFSNLVIVEYPNQMRLVKVWFQSPDSTVPTSTWLPLQPQARFGLVLSFVWFVLQVLVVLVGTLACWYRPFDEPARAFLILACLALIAFTGGNHWWVIAPNLLLMIPFVVAGLFLPPVLAYFTLVYPVPKPDFVEHPYRYRWALFGPSLVGSLLTCSLIVCSRSLSGNWGTGPFAATLERIASPIAAQSLPILSGTIVVYLGLTLLWLCASMWWLGSAWRLARTPQESSQVQILFRAASFGLIPVVYCTWLWFAHPVAFSFGGGRVPVFLASLAFMLAYGIGIARYKLMLVDQMLSRSVWYYLVSGLIALTFSAVIALVSVNAMQQNLSLFGQAIPIVYVLTLSILMLVWGRDTIQRILDRRFFREKYRLDRALQRMNRVAAGVLETESVAESLLNSCVEVLRCEHALLFSRRGEGSQFRLLSSQGRAQAPLKLQLDEETLAQVSTDGFLQRVPSGRSPSQLLLRKIDTHALYGMELDGKLTGLVALGPKPNGAAFTAEDVAFVTALGRMTAIALHCARVNAEVGRLNDDLREKMEKVSEQGRQIELLQRELSTLSQPVTPTSENPKVPAFDRGEIKGSSPAILRVLDTVRKVATSDASVLVRGESGTGKELLAQALHLNSSRKGGPLVTVHCAALSPTLLESELFGHVKGAFTDAREDKVGRFALANGGTLFLDEIGDISLEVQVKLLRVLQERTFEPVGSTRTQTVDVRLVTATHRNLEELIQLGRFREDLFYRLNVISVTLPPLRERTEDMVELSFHFLREAAGKAAKDIRRFDEGALELLRAHPWPGNIRELRNVIERAVVLAESETVQVHDLPPEIRSRRAASVAPPVRTTLIPAQAALRKTPAEEEADEVHLLQQALADCGGNKAEAARSLGIPRSTFFSKLKKHGLG